MTEVDPDIEAARAALRDMKDVPRKSPKTVHSVIKALLPDIEERLKTHSAEDVVPAVELALGKKIPMPTFFSVLCRVRKEVAQETPAIAPTKVRRRVKAAMNA